MHEIELLHTIRTIWLNRVTLNLARGANIREDVRAQLEHFFSLLEQAVETGDPSWIDPVLSTWPIPIYPRNYAAHLRDLPRNA
jgi:hypothetical protein